MLTGTYTWEPSRSSHTTTLKLFGLATSVLQDNHMSGRQLSMTEQEAQGAHTAVTGGCASLTKNAKSAEQVLAGSSTRAAWKCPACKHEWKARIAQRVLSNSGCAKCSSAARTLQPQPTFAEAQPAELAEWDHERNEAEGLYPHEVTLGSNKQVHWICSCCPRGQPHRWTATPPNRISNGSRCAVCAGQQACVCNSLETLFPSIAAECDVDKNGCAPSEVTAWSNKKVWWRNAQRGSWRQAVHVRTDKRLAPNTQQAGM
ncbi:hypothetical protein ABBQ38_011271 [Trebouxia sp. C0009 RCD-2024]